MRKRKSKSSLVASLLFATIIVVALYVYNSAMFEREMPNVSIKNNGYWNLKNPLEVLIEDTSGLKSYKITLKNGNDETTLEHERFLVFKESVKTKIEVPRSVYNMKEKEISILVEATDASKWNFLNGNSTVAEYKLKIDKRKPKLNIVAHSYKIKKGGAALVIFNAADENLKDIYIQTNFGKNFKAQPFYKDGYYISLLAWPVTQSDFKATIIVNDFADNESKSYIPLYLKDNKYKLSNIELSDKFLDGKIAELAAEFSETQGVTDRIEQFKIINEDIRAKNENLIHDITSKISDNMISDFKIKEMYPLKNAAIVAHFGDHRYYSYKGKQVSEAYHLGLDMASNAMAEIKPQNGGEVVYADYNGLYGNMPIISHGLGLYTLYGHCSSLNINSGDTVKGGSHIANTGKSGYAMGDHLHFGVIIQGVEVRPAEWMDTTWMKLNISNIIKSAKDIIDRG
ncbi:M23 family metallopeptidase [Candidatus Sulfurimonas baltica]|uniref:M23 family metallopeptidase n=1 Tax=Candidatus Sulfurimonas baltica TaxID=2740404 RepID=A0A7S7LTJ4_9BACT|nr:M23 family metallopeptidase [Candidatus Sulfurimonas baltica]QOY51276.1 M23 family metallopeptidase [Candidatus Sulfurimonas baltica]